MAAVGILELGLEGPVVGVELGGDTGGPQLGDHGLVLAESVAVHHRDHHRAAGRGLLALEGAEGGEEAVDADAGAAGGHLLAREALDEVVVAPAAGHGTEAAGAALLVDDLSGQLGLEDRAGVVGEAAHDGGIEHDLVVTEPADVEQPGHAGQLVDAGAADLVVGHQLAQAAEDVGARAATGAHEAEHGIDLGGREAGTLGAVAGGVRATLAEQFAHGVEPEAIELVHRAQDGELGPRLGDPGAVQDPGQDAAVVDPYDVVATVDADGLEGGGEHGADLGVDAHRRAADGVEVALVELSEAAGAGLLAAPHRSDLVAPERAHEVLAGLGHEAGQGRGEVVAERDPLLVVVTQGEDALVGGVLVGQVLAQRVQVLDGRGLEGLEAVQAVHADDLLDEGLAGRQVVGARVGETAREAGAGAVGGHVGEAPSAGDVRVAWAVSTADGA